jgi:hypothetical protein
MSVRTESEEIFERYMDGQNVPWTRVADSAQKHPDYKVEHGNVTCYFEVKEFEDPAVKPKGGFSPCPAIQEKVLQAKKQFRDYREHCCALVLWNSKSIYRSLFVDVVASAAFGKFVDCDAQSTGRLRADPPTYGFSGPGELSRSQNTTISAIVILGRFQLNHLWLRMWQILMEKDKRGEEITPWVQFSVLEELSSEQKATLSYEGTIRALILENPYARVPFPVDLLVGPFDQRWRMAGGTLRLATMGSELTQLRRSGVPFVFL